MVPDLRAAEAQIVIRLASVGVVEVAGEGSDVGVVTDLTGGFMTDVFSEAVDARRELLENTVTSLNF